MSARENGAPDYAGHSGAHTPGPWSFEDGYILANGEALKVVGVQIPMVVGHSRLEAIANARLIAAAPDMLEALKNLRRSLGCVVPWDIGHKFVHIYKEIDAAITKAEGRP